MSGGLMPWSVTSLVAQRLEFCRAAESGEVSFVELARRYGISPKTGYKWLARYREEGVEGLGDRSRRPLRSPGLTAGWVEEAVVAARERYPLWGGRKLRRVLLNEGIDPEVVPVPSTITEILRRRDLLGTAVGHGGGYTRFEEAVPNGMWQMDFKGWFRTGQGRVDPFDILDDHSRFNLCLQVSLDQTGPTVRGYLEATFRTYGLPVRILCDNGNPWGNVHSGYRWTSLGVWLLDLGIEVIHSRVAHPQTLGKDERFHRTLDIEVISTRPYWETHHQLQNAFDEWRTVYNHHRPHDSLNLDCPADHYHPSPRSMPETISPPDYPHPKQVRKVYDPGRFSYQGTDYRIGKPFQGKHIMVTPTSDTTIDIYYRHQRIRTIELN